MGRDSLQILKIKITWIILFMECLEFREMFPVTNETSNFTEQIMYTIKIM